MIEQDRYPCPDRRCPGLIPLDAGAEPESCHQCPKCHRPFPAKEIRTAPKFRQWKPEPRTNDNSHVQFWSQPIKRRLEQSTIGANQAAKRDLARYHALMDDHLPALPADVARHLVAYLLPLHEANTIGADVRSWSSLVERLISSFSCPFAALAGLHPVGRLAILDAADRAIREYADTPEPHLPDIVARHFRITPERS